MARFYAELQAAVLVHTRMPKAMATLGPDHPFLCAVEREAGRRSLELTVVLVPPSGWHPVETEQLAHAGQRLGRRNSRP